MGGLCKAKDSEVGAFEELGHLFSALQVRRLSMFVRKFAWAKHTLYPSDDFGVATFPTIHAVGKVIEPPQSERNKRMVR